jgi:geranylgeranyl diphosphate synthase, type II
VRGTIEGLFGPSRSQTDTIARQWLLSNGNRFRPFLVAAVAHGFGLKNISKDMSLQKLALAVECFHKASLIHDDIEDADSSRYGKPTLHIKWGVPIALNIGDLLLGEGYRLISEIDVSSESRNKLFQIASSRHVLLCRGQGEDLLYQRKKRDLPLAEVIAILKNKTVPLFEIALFFGLIYSNADTGVYEIIRSYGENIGIAYQILDDLVDCVDDSDVKRGSLSIVRAIESCYGVDKTSAIKKTEELYTQYRNQSFAILKAINNNYFEKMFFEITVQVLRDVSTSDKKK